MIEIRRIVEGEEALLDRVAPEVFDAPIDRSRLAAYVKQPGHLLLVAIAGGEVVGQCAAVMHYHPDKETELYIDEMAVAPAFHRKRIASRLMKGMFDLGKSLGCEKSWLGMENENTPARGLYQKFGAKGEQIVMFTYDL